MFKIATTSLAVLILAGCSTSSILTSTEPVQTTYALRVAQDVSPSSATGKARILEIAKPSLPPGFETDRIALYTQGGHKLDYFSAAKWPDILDNVVQDFTRRTATQTLPYVVAITPAQTLDANFRLQTKINEFQPVYETSAMAAPTLYTSVEFTLIALPEERMVSSFTLSKKGVASSNRLDVITQGLEKMLQEIEAEAFTKLDAHLKKPVSVE